MKSISEICSQVVAAEPKIVAIAGISEEEISLVKDALKEGLARFVLVDNKTLIEGLMKAQGLPLDAVEIVHVENAQEAPKKAVELVNKNKADIPMKGQVHTSTFLKAILNRENGLSSGKRLSQITMFDGYNGELQMLTDCAINISPSLDEKVDIINNSVRVFAAFSKEEPLVALLGAVETVAEKMPDTMDSAVLTQMNRRGQISGCVVDGPLSLDNAISLEFAQIKGINSPVAGKAQILVSSDLREANSLSKGIIHYAKRDACSIIAGTTIPIVMTSRTDLQKNKLNTIAVACFMFQKQEERR